MHLSRGSRGDYRLSVARSVTTAFVTWPCPLKSLRARNMQVMPCFHVARASAQDSRQISIQILLAKNFVAASAKCRQVRIRLRNWYWSSSMVRVTAACLESKRPTHLQMHFDSIGAVTTALIASNGGDHRFTSRGRCS